MWELMAYLVKGLGEAMRSLKPLFLILLLVGIVAGCSQEQSVKIRIGYSPYTVNLPLFIAVEEGLFLAKGLNVELVKFQSTNQMAESLSNGLIDVASALDAENFYVINNSSNGASLKSFFYNVFRSDSGVDGIVCREGCDSIEFPIAVLPAKMMQFALDVYLDDSSEGNRYIVTLPPSTILSSMSSGDIKSAYLLEPLITISKLKMNTHLVVKGLAEKAIVDPLPAGFHSINIGFDESHPGIVDILRSVYAEAAVMAAKDKKYVAKALEKYCNLPLNVGNMVALPDWEGKNDVIARSLKIQFEFLKKHLGWIGYTYDNRKHI